MAIPIIAGAAAAAALLPAILGKGQNKRHARGFYAAEGYDPDAQYYGGYKSGLRDYNANLNYRRNEAEIRPAFQANYNDANQDRAFAIQERAGETAMADLMRRRALGLTPSISQMQADRQMQQAQAAQAAQSASARGAGALALAQQNASNNIANTQGAISNQAQINAAQERLSAEQAAMGAYGQMRQGDIGMQAQDANQAQFQTQLQQLNRNANDQRAMGYEQLESTANQAALQGRVQSQGQLAASYTGVEQANQHSADQNASNKGILGGIVDLFKADGGPVKAGRTYVVGERGPELVTTMRSDMRSKDPMLMPGSGGSMMAPAATETYGANFGAVPASGSYASEEAPADAGDGGGGILGGILSDTRAKKAALLTQGRREGAAAAMKGGPSMQAMLDDRAKQFDSNRFAWDKSGFNEALAAQDAQDKADIDIDRQAAERQALDAKNARDPAVGLERIAQDRKFINRRNVPSNDNARLDEEAGLAPGTTDFETTAPKPPAPGAPQGTPGSPIPSEAPVPWWMQLNEAAKTLNQAQFGTRFDQREDGGPVKSGKTYLVGERGPELVTMKKDGYVTPNEALRGLSDEHPGAYDAGAEAARAVQPTSPVSREALKGGRDPQSFHRDSKAEQAAIKKAYEDRAAAQADAIMAGYQQQMAQGPAAQPAEEPAADQRLAVSDQTPLWLRQYMVSDERAKQEAYQDGWQAGAIRAHRESANGFDEKGKGLLKSAGLAAYSAPITGGFGPIASLPMLVGAHSASNVRDFHDEAANEIERARQARKKPQREMKEFKKDSDADQAATAAAYQAAQRPDPIADANRSMAGSAYAYKEGMTPPEQAPGEVNVGPMAQNMEQSPVAATAVKTDPQTGLKVIDKDKALKVVMSGLADLQQQQDETRSNLQRLNKGGRKRQ